MPSHKFKNFAELENFLADLDKNSLGNRGSDGFRESPHWFVIPCRILYQLYSIFFP